ETMNISWECPAKASASSPSHPIDLLAMPAKFLLVTFAVAALDLASASPPAWNHSWIAIHMSGLIELPTRVSLTHCQALTTPWVTAAVVSVMNWNPAANVERKSSKKAPQNSFHHSLKVRSVVF